MPGEFEIGRVVGVDTAQITVELDPGLKALTRMTHQGALEVGRVNSYVTIPSGSQRVLAMVTRVVMTEETELKTDRTMVTFPTSRKLLRATMIGAVTGDGFVPGVSNFPALDSPVLAASRTDLDAVFGVATKDRFPTDPEHPGFCVPIGMSVVFPDYPVSINPDLFFGKHAAIIGSTGSGKSCSIATVVQSVLDCDQVQATHFIILDTNGEYAPAFPGDAYRSLYISTEPKSDARLVIPYWIMNADDFTRLFRASPGIQQPVLLDALRSARAPQIGGGDKAMMREFVLQEFYETLSIGEGAGKTNDLYRCLTGLVSILGQEEVRKNLPNQSLDKTKSDLESLRTLIKDGAEKYPMAIPADIKLTCRNVLTPIIDAMVSETEAPDIPRITADTPVWFGKSSFVGKELENAMKHEKSSSARAREYCGTMLMRIRRFLQDSRFEFLFGDSGVEMPNPIHGLATFLRDLLGLPPSGQQLSGEEVVSNKALPFYGRQRTDPQAPNHNVVIVDLSLLPSEVLENVVALIGRLVLEFLQRISDTDTSGIERGEFPVVMILEEAQNYIKESDFGEEASISKRVFERIAREGRKYGLSLVVASQRPSEMSKTVLSQCNSFIVHRLQNPEDLRYFKQIVPGIYEQMLDQLPALAPRTALVLGESVRAPALVYMREARPRPRSSDPRFYSHWVSKPPKTPNVEAVAAKWEQKQVEPSAGGTVNALTNQAKTPGSQGGTGGEASD
jgi:hypothetical protein